MVSMRPLCPSEQPTRRWDLMPAGVTWNYLLEAIMKTRPTTRLTASMVRSYGPDRRDGRSSPPSAATGHLRCGHEEAQIARPLLALVQARPVPVAAAHGSIRLPNYEAYYKSQSPILDHMVELSQIQMRDAMSFPEEEGRAVSGNHAADHRRRPGSRPSGSSTSVEKSNKNCFTAKRKDKFVARDEGGATWPTMICSAPTRRDCSQPAT